MTHFDQASASSVRLGMSFRLLMRIRLLVTALSLLLLPSGQVGVGPVLVVSVLAILCWLAAFYWQKITPQLMKHPLLVGIDISICFIILGLEGPQGPFFLSTLVTSVVAGLLYRWRGMLFVSGFQILSYFSALGYYTELHEQVYIQLDTFQTMLGQPAYYPAVGVVGIMLRRFFDEQVAIDSARHEAEIRTMAADERARLAREMHDSLAKTLRGIAMSAQSLRPWIQKSPERAVAVADGIISAAEVASREARGLIADLRDDHVQQPLCVSVEQLIEKWSAGSEAEVVTELDGAVDLTLIARYELITILKEALVNIDRHAEATHIMITVTGTDAEVVLVIEDDGHGFSAPTGDNDWLSALARDGHYGLLGMYERARRAGALMTIRSAPDQGTTITVTFSVDDSHRLPHASMYDQQSAEAK